MSRFYRRSLTIRQGSYWPASGPAARLAASRATRHGNSDGRPCPGRLGTKPPSPYRTFTPQERRVSTDRSTALPLTCHGSAATASGRPAGGTRGRVRTARAEAYPFDLEGERVRDWRTFTSDIRSGDGPGRSPTTP